MTLVVDEARKLVDELGAQKVTARMIAERVGYTAGTLYTHFANLQDIFLHVNARNLAALKATIEEAVRGAPGPRRALLAMGRAYLRFAQDYPNRFALMFTTLMPHGEDAPAYLQQPIDALFAVVEQELVRLAPDCGREQLELGVRALWCGVHGVCALAKADQLFTRRWRADEAILETLITQFLSSWPDAEPIQP